MEYSEFAKRKEWTAGNRLQAWISVRILKEIERGRRASIEQTSILEVGCGTGLFAVEVERRGARRYVGIEPNAQLAEITRGRIQTAEIFEAALPQLPAELKKSFDVVVAIHVIEHAESGHEAREWVAELLSCLNDGGTLVLISPNALDYRMYFWDIDWSHGFPTTINNIRQILQDLDANVVQARILRLGSLSIWVGAIARLASILTPTRFLNIVGQRLVGRELGTGLQSAVLWGVTFILAKNSDSEDTDRARL